MHRPPATGRLILLIVTPLLTRQALATAQRTFVASNPNFRWRT